MIGTLCPKFYTRKAWFRTSGAALPRGRASLMLFKKDAYEGHGSATAVFNGYIFIRFSTCVDPN